MSEFLVITGLSGAGRSQAADTFEDLGWFVIDNLPPALIGKVAELVASPGSTVERVVLVAGTGQYLDELSPALDLLRKTARSARVLYLEASDEVLVRRYENTRRRHPRADQEGVLEGIERERHLLEGVRSSADVVIDTSDLNVHQLREQLLDVFSLDTGALMQTSVVSFGYKHGLPVEADLVFDCRFLANPHWVDDLRPLAGTDAAVREHVLGQPGAVEFVDRVEDLLVHLLPAFERERKAYLTIAVGCTGGRHRSVVIAEELARRLREREIDVSVSHRDIDR